MTTGEQYDGKRLFNLVQNERSPFEGVWDVKLLIREVEEKLGVRVVDIPSIERGSNNYVSGCYMYLEMATLCL